METWTPRDTKWRGRWINEHGAQEEVEFYSQEYEVVARVDFQFVLMDMQKPVPNQFEVERVSAGPIVINGTLKGFSWEKR